MADVTAPVEGFEGTVAGVEFKNGKASTDSEGALAYFAQQGYTVSDDSYAVTDDALQAGGTEVLGTPIFNPPGPLDAADPSNDLNPVGGVKSAAAPGAPVGVGSRGKRAAAKNQSDQPADTTPAEPVAAQEDTQSAPSATTATTPTAAPVGDDTAPDATKPTPAPDPAKPADGATTAGSPAIVTDSGAGQPVSPAPAGDTTTTKGE